MWNHKKLSAYFEDGKELVQKAPESISAKISVEKIGDIKLSSGKIVASDPFYADEGKAFERTVAPGAYPVFLSLAHITFEGASQVRVAAAKIQFSDEPVESWVVAGLPGEAEKIEAFTEGQFLGHSVDGGTSSYFDEEFVKYMAEHRNEVLDAIDAGLDAHMYYAVVSPEGASSNFIVFKSGYGDGMYGCFWGLNKDGKAVALATDFSVLGGEEWWASALSV